LRDLLDAPPKLSAVRTKQNSHPKVAVLSAAVLRSKRLRD
jgi:hypothetical protein